MKSEDAPKTNKEPVKIVVATTFSEIVLNKDSDVLVEFHAPWCVQPCIQFEPIFDKLGKNLKDIKGLTIAKMDVSANEVAGLEVEVKYFPILIFYPKGAKNNPQDLEVGREVSLDDLMGFLKSNSKALKSSKKITDL
jgi:protein disulfide-isomerase A1